MFYLYATFERIVADNQHCTLAVKKFKQTLASDTYDSNYILDSNSIASLESLYLLLIGLIIPIFLYSQHL